MDDDPRRSAHHCPQERVAQTRGRADPANLGPLVASRLEGLRWFNEWESRERSYLPFEAALRSLDDLRKLVSQDTRTRDLDPERAGVRRMHEILGCLRRTTLSIGGPR